MWKENLTCLVQSGYLDDPVATNLKHSMINKHQDTEITGVVSSILLTFFPIILTTMWRITPHDIACLFSSTWSRQYSKSWSFVYTDHISCQIPAISTKWDLKQNNSLIAYLSSETATINYVYNCDRYICT